MPRNLSLSRRYLDEMSSGFQPIFAIEQDNMGLPVFGLLFAHHGESGDNYLVTRLDFACRCPINCNSSAPTRGGERVC